jgi:hypothetical protein
MHKPQAVQLAFEFVEKRPAGFLATRPLLKHRSCNTVLKKLAYVRRFFPELGEKTIRVGLTRVASGMAVPGGYEIWLNPSQISYHAIAHEFIHLLQGEYGIPTGERSCDLYSMARHWTLNDTAPYYVRIPRRFLDATDNIQPTYARLVYAVAKRAIELRQNGMRKYIAHFEKTLASNDAQVWLERNGLAQPNHSERDRASRVKPANRN